MARVTSCILTVLMVCVTMEVILAQSSSTEIPTEETTTVAESVSSNDTVAESSPESSTVSGGNNGNGGGNTATDGMGDDSSQPTQVPSSDNSTANTTDGTGSVNGTGMADSDIGNTDGPTAIPSDVSTAEPSGAGNTAEPGSDVTQPDGTAEPEYTTMAAGSEGNDTTSVMCYQCSGDDCSKSQTDTATMCTSAQGVCYMTFDINNANMTARGCDSTFLNITSCTDEYPSGFHANGRCGYCCKTDKCNGVALSEGTCQDLAESGMAPLHHVTSYVTGSLLILGTYFVQSLTE